MENELTFVKRKYGYAIYGLVMMDEGREKMRFVGRIYYSQRLKQHVYRKAFNITGTGREALREIVVKLDELDANEKSTD